MDKADKWKKFSFWFIIWVLIFSLGLITKEFQNDTFYTIKIGKLILNNGIDMLDHFSFHANLAYTYPHWLYDVFIYLIFSNFGYTGLYISSIIIMFIILLLVFKTNKKITDNYIISAFSTIICALALAGFVTSRAQSISFILFVLEIYFIESFLKGGKKRYLVGLILISLIICNIHVAVWPFYFILYLPYLAEYIIALIVNKIKFNEKNKFILFLKRKIEIEKNDNVKYLFLIMFASLLTGFITPIGFTPYTYFIKTAMGNSQKYIQEHQMLTWAHSPFTIIIAGEAIFLALFSKAKLRDLFMIGGLTLMSVLAIRHMSLLALIGTICFARIFSMFFTYFDFLVFDKILSFLSKKIVFITLFILVIVFSYFMVNTHIKKNFINKELYPVEAVKYIKSNIDINDMKLFNDYNFGSYLLLNDIPVFIDSRADLYTKEFSGFDYDIFDDYEASDIKYSSLFEFYGITHALIYKKIDKNTDNILYNNLRYDKNYNLLYDDKYFALFKKNGKTNLVFTIEN